MAYGNGLSGNQSLAYVGTSANQPPNWTFEKRDPTIYDINSNLGDLWMNLVEQTAWILVSLQGSPTSRGPLATWLEFGGGTGDVVSLTGNTGGRVYSTLGNINVVGDGVTTTVSGDPSTNTLTISTSGIEANSFPTDSGTATPAAGVLNINAIESPLANCGSSVQFTGSGNTVLLDVTDSNFNTIMGDRAGASGPTGVQNTSFGALSSFYLTTGTKNTAIGYAANFSLPFGSGNIAIGEQAGSGWLSNESGNICIGSVGGVGDNHVLRIGSGTGSGIDQLLGAKIAGIDGVNVGSVAEVVTMGTGGNADRLGTAVITAGTGITVTPGANTITISASGIDAQSFPTDSGTATPVAGVLNINGGTGVVTSAPGDTNIVEISIADGIADQYDADSGTATPSGNTLNIYGGAGITTSAAGDTVTITAVTGTFPTDSGTATPFAGALNINAGLSTVLCGSSVKFTGSGNTVELNISDANANTMIGQLSGNLSMSGTNNTALGFQCLENLTSGSNNISLGYISGQNYSTESNNIVIGNDGVALESGVTRIGTHSVQNKFYAAGIDGVNVGSVATVVTEASDQLGTAVLTAGTGITITPSANVITIASTMGGFTWHNVVAVGAAMLAENGYIADAVGLLTFTLPTNSALGDTIKLMGKGSGGWTVTYGANQNIIYGKVTTTTTTGSLSSTQANDCIELICSTASATQPIFTVFSSIGNLSIT